MLLAEKPEHHLTDLPLRHEPEVCGSGNVARLESSSKKGTHVEIASQLWHRIRSWTVATSATLWRDAGVSVTFPNQLPKPGCKKATVCSKVVRDVNRLMYVDVARVNVGT